MEKIKIFIKKNRISIIIILILSFSTAHFWLKYMDLRWDILYGYEMVPHYDLHFSLSKSSYQGNEYYTGTIVGFVKFDDIDSQPKGVQQYYVIEPALEFDENKRQIFYVDDILKMKHIPPKSTGDLRLTLLDDQNGILLLVDQYSHNYQIDTVNQRVRLFDGESSTLMTDNQEYADFQRAIFEKNK